MEPLLAPQIEWIFALQQEGPQWLWGFFSVFTDFGGRHYLWLVPGLLWCVDFRTGLRVMLLMALTIVVNTALKEWIADPRPFQFDARVISEGEDGYGLPSGHAQLVVIFWGVLAAWVGRRPFWAAAVVVMFLMGFSRVYLGVHFPSDVLAGWALGALTLWLWLRYGGQVEAWLAQQARPELLALGAGLTLLAFDRLLVRDEHFLAAGGAGFLAGTGVAAALALRSPDFLGHGAWWRRLLRYVLGMALTIFVLGAMRRLGVPDGALAGPAVFVDLALLALWQAWVLPRLFVAIRLGDEPPASGP